MPLLDTEYKGFIKKFTRSQNNVTLFRFGSKSKIDLQKHGTRILQQVRILVPQNFKLFIFTEVVGLINLIPPNKSLPTRPFFLAKIFFVKILRDRRFGGVRHFPDQNLKKRPKIKILKFMREKKNQRG